jgi:hypothetical protein
MPADADIYGVGSVLKQRRGRLAGAQVRSRRNHLASQAVDQLGAVSRRAQGAHGDGSPVKRLQFRAWSRAGEDPAARRPHSTGGPLGFGLTVDKRDIAAVQRFGEPGSTHPTDAGMATQTLGCGFRDRLRPTGVEFFHSSS